MSVFRQIANINVFNNNGIGDYAIINPDVNLLDNPVSFISKGYASTLNFDSANDISGINFTINGTFNDKKITEVLTGPNAGTVVTRNLYHTVESIVADGALILINMSIGSNGDVAVILNDRNTTSMNNFNMTDYHVKLTSLTAAAQWAAGDVLIYGICGRMSELLTKHELTYNTRSSNYYSINNPFVAIPQADLNKGLIANTNYSFTGIIVYLTNNVITTPCFVEITQS
jgi:hypothetical protein